VRIGANRFARGVFGERLRPAHSAQNGAVAREIFDSDSG
jgi:hypothetical protein